MAVGGTPQKTPLTTASAGALTGASPLSSTTAALPPGAGKTSLFSLACNRSLLLLALAKDAFTFENCFRVRQRLRMYPVWRVFIKTLSPCGRKAETEKNMRFQTKVY